VPIHKPEDCGHSGTEFGNGVEAIPAQREKPFAALEALLKDNATKT
jgi:uncharacterized metal-binding protein YceD (DUF177 family)